jgi:hypothetical protein
MKKEVVKIFADLEAWRDHCRFNGLRFDEADLYKSRAWREFAGLDAKRPKPPSKFKKQKR